MMQQLRRVPATELKIDRPFVQDAVTDARARVIVQKTIELGHGLGMRVVAEGVEEPEAWNLLRRLGCDYAQGYLISRPMAATDVPAFVGRANELLPPSDSTLLQIRALDQLTRR